MSLSLPPAGRRPSPRVRTLPAGSILWRLHSDRFESAEFNPVVPKRFAGGRFDATDGTYSYLYAGSDTVAAVAETLLRDRPARGAYFIPRKRLEDKRLSKLEVTRALSVVRLHGAGLTAIRQTADLTSSGPEQYVKTRAWAVALRFDAASAGGFEWRPRHDNDRLAYVFFGDRCTTSDFLEKESYSLLEGRGRALVRRALAWHGVSIA